ncbi:tRNA (uridine(34)/cytosine(34)/5-carboxymethylaminomethyluridine(34)-2'-O)-methyltransferase TrmL [Camelliibacillus cellulosilyticus]|uniref:Putative tRNA (cytidine(34)-2'-O)-methyltransferase n=1 Tax=Camelliibacillus cellulosilyticus TaxID=2174486 RepID=A0ABV9GLI7_9BACL
MSLHVVLYQPEIPSNTGNIARTCAATGTTLHLIRPLGFSTDDKMLKRAGLDYWPHVDIRYYDSLEELFERYIDGDFYYLENYGENNYTDYDFTDVKKAIFFVFGRETSGLPSDLLEPNKDRFLRLPMTGVVRSLNLANTVAVMVYEALRQQGFPALK